MPPGISPTYFSQPVYECYRPLRRVVKRCYAGAMSTKQAQLDWREGQRRARKLKQEGWKQPDIIPRICLPLGRSKGGAASSSWSWR